MEPPYTALLKLNIYEAYSESKYRFYAKKKIK